MPQPARAIISYAHEDDKYRERLVKALKLMERQGLVAAWHDRLISAGGDWNHEIDAALEEADLILLLVSPDFIASDYCWGLEMKRGLERHEAGEARLVPIIVRACDWEASPLQRFQALPTGGKPLASWRLEDEGWLDVTRGLRRLVESREDPEIGADVAPRTRPGAARDRKADGVAPVRPAPPLVTRTAGAAPGAKPLSEDALSLRRFDPRELVKDSVLAETGHSVIERCSYRDRDVVLKRTLARLCDLEALERIAGETIVARRGLTFLIATPLVVWTEGDFVCELYERYDGATFASVVSRNRYPISGDFLGELFVSAVEALARLHDTGVLHRDLSPSNLLIQPGGEVVLLDASFCCTVDGEQVPFENKEYSAPEVIRGQAVPQSDWYSLACTLFFLSTGTSPRRLSADELRATRLDLGSYGSRQELFLSLLEEEPAKRPQESSQLTLHPESAPPAPALTAVLELGVDQRYLLLARNRYTLVGSDEILPLLIGLPKSFSEWMESGGEGPLLTRPESRRLRRDIERFAAGEDPWTR